MMSFDCFDNSNGAIRRSAITNLRGLNRLVDEGYVMRRLLNPSQTVYSITAKGRAVLHEAEGND
jgi:DNA-binding PadR family transcriptional regulator